MCIVDVARVSLRMSPSINSSTILCFSNWRNNKISSTIQHSNPYSFPLHSSSVSDVIYSPHSLNCLLWILLVNNIFQIESKFHCYYLYLFLHFIRKLYLYNYLFSSQYNPRCVAISDKFVFVFPHCYL